MIRPLSVEIAGFMGVKDPITVPLDEPGLTCILGANGASKTTRYVESLCWCLFGETLKNSEVINDDSLGCMVSLRLKEGDVTYQVTRAKSRGKSESLSVVEAGVPGEKFAAANLAERQSKLIAWLGMDFETFTNSVVLGQNAKAFFAGLSDEEKKRIFDRVCGLEEIESALKAAGDALVAAQSDHKFLTGVLDGLRVRRTDLKASLAQEEQSVKWHVEEKAAYVANMNELIDKKAVAIKEQKAKKDAAEAASKASEATFKEASFPEVEAQLTEIIEDSRRSYLGLVDLHRDLTVSVNATATAILTLAREAESYEEAIRSSICPTCGQPTSSKKAFEELLATARKQKAEAEEKAKALANELNEAVSGRDESKTVLDEAVSQKEALKESRTQLAADYKSKCELLNREIAVLADLEKEHAALVSGLTAYLETAGKFRSRVEEIEVEVEKVEDEILSKEKELSAAEVELSVCKFWVQGFGPKGLKAFVIEANLPKLNRATNEHLTALSDGAISCRVTATTPLKKGGVVERMSVEVENRNGAKRYSGQSGGEQSRVNLAFLMGFQDLNRSRASKVFPLAVYDEILAFLDEEGILKTVEYLGVRARETGTPIYLISHDDRVKRLVESVREVRKGEP